LRPVLYGEIKTPKDSLLSATLISVYQQLSAVISLAAPQSIVLENIFTEKRPQSD